MRRTSRRSGSPIMWRAGGTNHGVDESSNASKTWISQDSPPNSLADDGYDDGESYVSEIPVQKHQNFDELLRRIEAERQKMTTTSENGAARTGTSRGHTDERERENPSSASSNNYDYAGRARELRMSLDGAPKRSISPKRPERSERARDLRKSLDNVPARSASAKRPERERTRELKSLENIPVTAKSLTPKRPERSERARDLRMTLDGVPSRTGTGPRRAHRESPPPRKSRMSYDGMPSRTLPLKRSESGTASGNTSHRARNTPPRSTSKALVRSTSSPAPNTSPVRSTSPNPSQEDFQLQVKKFHSSLVLAHDTISSLENDVRSLKGTISSLEERNRSLEERNKSLNNLLSTNRVEVIKMKEENDTMTADTSGMFRRHNKEIEKLRAECERHRKYAREIEKLSTQRDAAVEEIHVSKRKLESDIRDKDKKIGNMRKEIHRLNGELAEGAVARSNASKVEEAMRKLESEIRDQKSNKTDQQQQQQQRIGSNTKVVVDLDQANVTITRSS